MKRNIFISSTLTILLLLALILSGCNKVAGILDKTPEKYIEGIKYDRDFPDKVLEIYDDAIVYESRLLFDEVILTFGSEDDFDDVVDFYKDFFEENEIILQKEDEKRNQYFAQGQYDGYEFRLQIQEPDGEYIEDLFESIIYFSSKEIDDAMALKVASPTVIPKETPSPTKARNTPTPQALTATPAPTINTKGETPLGYIKAGTWTSKSYYWEGKSISLEVTIHINDDSTGTFYYYDYDSDRRDFYYFTYELNGDIFDIITDSGTSPYYAYYDDGILHLKHRTQDAEIYMINWNDANDIYPNENDFTAYGDWIYYDPDSGYIETIAFWPNGSGYVYNWGGSNENYYMQWIYENGVFTIYDELDNEYSYGMVHRGDVFELTTIGSSGGGVYFYSRVSGEYWLNGNFYMEDTNDSSCSDWAFSLYPDNTYEYTLNGEEATSNWFINRFSGKLYMAIGDTYIGFDYHYDSEGLFLYDEDYGLYYDLVGVG